MNDLTILKVKGSAAGEMFGKNPDITGGLQINGIFVCM
jgi:hypothetical protein